MGESSIAALDGKLDLIDGFFPAQQVFAAT